YKNGDPIGLINLFVNSCLFIPFPLLLKLNYSNLKIRYCFFIPFGSILACECLQYFVGRASDIDDVILNTVGILFGMLFLQLINKLQMRTAHK
ncbi:MAG TPA: VanZ family protein, partial [Clostridia bacterium]|nr:VanZ family protein [Clostridia bacterium]